ncbi:intracellular protein transport protein USO1-like [Melia azedarach]|uniref:Intracellular protein transport protein USO1-like n=1 Tax=Melia azedarach TaxID=155640 RepID=A0ACC1XLY7_MELAZ|nr:intracellular protein transport protein USO1-like [Melia azedarach]
MEDKVKKILKLVKSKENGIARDSKKDSELVGLIKDLHDQYQSLLYNRLKGDPGKRSRGRRDKGRSYSSCSSSDSEYYSSEDIEINNSNVRNAHHKATHSFKQALKGENPEVSDLKHKLMSTIEEKEALRSEYREALSKIQAAEAMNKNLRDEAYEKQREISNLVKVHEDHGSQTSAQIKELERQLSGLKLELESLHEHKRELEAQCASKATEAKEAGKKNIELHSRVSELELISKEKGNEMANLLQKYKNNENILTSKNEELMAQVSYLEAEVDSLRVPKEKAVDQVKSLLAQANVMQQDLVSLTSQKNELEMLLEGKKEEISEYLIKLNAITDELTEKTAVEQRLLKEKEGFVVQVKDLELEIESMCNQKNKLEEQIDSKNEDTKLLREENQRLHVRLSAMENQLSALQRKCEDPENEASTQNLVLKAQIDNLKQKLDDVQLQKIQLETQIVREKQESLKSLTEMEQQNFKLTNKIADQQKVMKEREDTIEKLTEEFKQAKSQILGSKASIHVAERKMTELAEDFRKQLEDNVRVLYRRILVAEQLHNENKDSYEKTKEQLQESNRLLQARFGLNPRFGARAAQSKQIRNMLEPGNQALSELDSVVRKLESKGDLSKRISKMSNELAFAKNWVTESNNHTRRLQEQVESLIEKLDDKEEQESLLREKVSNLEAKLGKQGGDKLNMIKDVSDLEKKVGELENKIKEKDANLLTLGEEKREAIRQLCLWIDHHRTHSNHLKGVIAKNTLKGRTIS